MKRTLLIIGIVLGGFLATGPTWGVLGTMLGMMSAFRELGKQGVGDPSTVSASIDGVLFSTVGGLVAFPIGVILLVTCIILLVRDSRRPQNPAKGTAGM